MQSAGSPIGALSLEPQFMRGMHSMIASGSRCVTEFAQKRALASIKDSHPPKPKPAPAGGVPPANNSPALAALATLVFFLSSLPITSKNTM